MAALRATNRNIASSLTSLKYTQLATPIHPVRSIGPLPPRTAKLGSSFSTEASPEMAAELRGKVDQMIEKNRAVIIGKSWCSFSRRAISTLKPVAPDLQTWDIDLTEHESLIQEYLYRKTGQSTVPFVFINQQFIGGNSELQRIPLPQLKQLLNKKPAPTA